MVTIDNTGSEPTRMLTMKFTRQSMAAALLATSFAACVAASAAPAAAVSDAPEAAAADAPPGVPGGPDERGPGPREDGGPGPGGPGRGMPFGPLHGVKLTDAQEDKLFNIMHAQAPQRRDHDKAIRKAEDGLRELGRAERFDDAKAAALARDLGQAIAAQELLRVRTDAQVLAILTAEQRTELRERRQHGHGRDGGPERGDGPGPHDSK
jgi:Spy/CpxP family protein refolding chaperone